MKEPIDAARRFLALADRDIKAFDVLKNATGVHPETIFFHAQQAVEKILKGVLAAHNIAPTRTHDLEALVYAIRDIPINLPIDLQELAKLNPYVVTLRYSEMDISIISKNEADDIVKKMRTWADTQI